MRHWDRYGVLQMLLRQAHRDLWSKVRPLWLPNAVFGHGPDHAVRAYRHAMQIGGEMSADLLVVGAACLMMDSGLDVKAGRTGHVKRSIDICRTVCRGLPLLAPACEQIVAAIDSHEGDGSVEARSLEAIVVRDSDTLDRLGFPGIRMTLLYGQWIGRSAFHPKDPLCLNRDPDLDGYTLDYLRYLDTLAGRVVTPLARNIVSVKQEESLRFWRALEPGLGRYSPAGHRQLLLLLASLRSKARQGRDV